MVVAGDSEDKPEVAARVAWSDVGLNLRTGAPTATAVRRVLGGAGFREKAKAMADAVAGYSALVAVEEAMGSAVAETV
jgi:UDP:flavonoid glycosyltransferase YjiC (YdhE family)